jgi:uncharacterized Zn-finger protein
LVSWCPLQVSIAHKNKANGTAGNTKLITGLSSICPNGPNVSTPKLWAQVKNFLSPRITSSLSFKMLLSVERYKQLELKFTPQ